MRLFLNHNRNTEREKELIFLERAFSEINSIKYIEDLEVSLRNYSCDIYFSCSDYERLEIAADKHIHLFSHVKNKEVAFLNEKLRKLKNELKKFGGYNPNIIASINAIIKNLKALTSTYINYYKQAIKWTKKTLLKLLSRNLRFYFRQIFQFYFKNLDDESDSDFLIPGQPVIIFITINNFYNEIQRKSNFKPE